MPYIEPKQLTVPNEPYYPVERLYLFDRYTRATWRQTFGEQAPPWNKERRIKRWADSTAKGITRYTYFDWARKSFKQMELSEEEAKTPNLPGAFEYPKWIVAPTPAVVVGPGALDPQPLNPQLLSSIQDALDLAKELGGTVQLPAMWSGPFHVDWRGETRRNYNVVVGDNAYNVGLLLMHKYSQGVGAPGRWEMARTGPVWVSEVPQDVGEQDIRPEIPIPCRPLDDRLEALKITPFGALVYRKDIESEINPKTQASEGIPSDLAEAIYRIDRNVMELLRLKLTP
jgi:hypothetical protein